jgi:hypothetical protein
MEQPEQLDLLVLAERTALTEQLAQQAQQDQSEQPAPQAQLELAEQVLML